MKKVSVQCRGIGLSYGSTEVLKGVDLDIQPGEFFALLGPSGSGKSTLLRLMAGFARHQRGELLIDGVDVSAQAPWQRQVGLVFQNYALWPHLSVWDNVAFGLVERREPAAVIRQKVGAALDLVGLADYGQRRPNQLSGGQQQRVALARTLVIEPQVLLLDEPLSNLDKTLRVQMRQELLAMQRRLGLTTIFVTHDQEEAMTTADRMAVLDQGVVQQVGTPRTLYDEPANAFVATFVGTNNLLDVHLQTNAQSSSARIEWPGLGTWPWAGAVPAGAPSRCVLSFRPHAVTLLPTPAPDVPASCVQADAIVQAHEFCGETTRYRLRVGDHGVLADRPHRSGLAPWAPGTRVTMQLDLGQARLLV